MNNTEKTNSKEKSCKGENCITVSATYGEKNEKTLTGFKTLLELNRVSRHCGLDPQSPANFWGIPAFAGMTALIVIV